METTALWTAWAWIGWAATTAVLAALYGLTGLLGKKVFCRITRIYHLHVVGYWLDRLEREGTHVFEKASQNKQ